MIRHGEVRRCVLHRGGMGIRVRAERDAAVVGHVQPLVPVRRPRVGLGVARDEVAERRARRRPQPERPVDVHPCVDRLRRLGHGGEIVDRTGVHLSGLGAHDRRAAAAERVERRDVDPALPVRREHDLLGLAYPEQAERPREGHVAFPADDDAEGRRPRKAPGREVPARALVDGVARCGEARHVRHLAPGHEGEGGV